MSRIEHVLREIQQLIEFYDKTKDLREKIPAKSKKKNHYDQDHFSINSDTIKEKKKAMVSEARRL